MNFKDINWDDIFTFIGLLAACTAGGLLLNTIGNWMLSFM